MSKLAEYRATHDNPHGSDYTFIPDAEGINILIQFWNVVKGLGRGRSVQALNHKAVDPKDPAVMDEMREAHDTNQFILGDGRFSDKDAAERLPNRKQKKKRR